MMVSSNRKSHIGMPNSPSPLDLPRVNGSDSSNTHSSAPTPTFMDVDQKMSALTIDSNEPMRTPTIDGRTPTTSSSQRPAYPVRTSSTTGVSQSPNMTSLPFRQAPPSLGVSSGISDRQVRTSSGTSNSMYDRTPTASNGGNGQFYAPPQAPLPALPRKDSAPQNNPSWPPMY